jgi:hypothetical protein
MMKRTKQDTMTFPYTTAMALIESLKHIRHSPPNRYKPKDICFDGKKLAEDDIRCLRR